MPLINLSKEELKKIKFYLLQYPDMTIRDFFTMASEEIREEEEELGYYE